jgi:molybdopterin molybdotransferase
LKSIGTTLAAGEIYDSNRYTLHGMLTRLGCEVLDMGVVEDEPKKLESASTAAQSADVVITSGGVSAAKPTTSSSCSTSSAKCCSGKSR